LISDHRIQRAKERYGVELTPEDIVALEATLSPANRLKAHGAEIIHLVKHRGIAMLAGVRAAGRWAGRICTFLPPDAMAASTRKAFRKQRAKTRNRNRP
jgi:hypothetical protein